MWEASLEVLFSGSVLVIVYHHFLYPLLLTWLVRGKSLPSPDYEKRCYQASAQDDMLPVIAIIVPAYNEEKFIAEKLRNLAALDYPAEKLQIFIYDDGSTDDTLNVANKTLLEPELAEAHIEIRPLVYNGGKIALINRAMNEIHADIAILTDASALLSHDALLIVAAHMRTPDIGVVAGIYALATPGSEGEAAYWQYQTRIKKSESVMGSVVGVHGAMYAIRTSLFQKIPGDTINDDFIIPMNVVAAGYRCLYEPAVVAVELEKSNTDMDAHRRRRIALGNVQQMVRLAHLCHPRYGAVAFNFASGKVLRALMPAFLLTAFLSSLGLALLIPECVVIVLVEAILFFIYLWQSRFPSRSRIAGFIYYFFAGHLAAAEGLYQYWQRRPNGPWKRATEKTMKRSLLVIKANDMSGETR